MPTPKRGLSLNIDLLKPQTRPQKLYVQLIRWSLSAGRYLIIFVEVIVLAAFLTRFRLDTEIADNKDLINQQLPFIEALKGDEDLIRQTQFQLASLKNLQAKQFDFNKVLDQIAAQTPTGVTISTLDLTLSSGGLDLKLGGVAQNNDQISTFLYGLRQDAGFTDVSITSIGLAQGSISFSISGSGGKP